MIYKRKASVAGRFYDSNSESLIKQLENCFLHEYGPLELPHSGVPKNERSIMGIVSPHAGYMFSGPIAAHNYFRLSFEKTPKTIFILGPNHTSMGEAISIMTTGQWETPLGVVEIDRSTSHDILINDEANHFQEDIAAHKFEHSIEVQLPFLQYIYPDSQYRIVPICIARQQLNLMEYLSKVILKVIKNNYRDFLLIASSDFNHRENQEVTKKKDRKSIEQIINMDSKQFYQAIFENNNSICGPGPISVIIETCKKLGIKKGKLLKYATSGDISGIYEEVVGYASIIFELFR